MSTAGPDASYSMNKPPDQLATGEPPAYPPPGYQVTQNQPTGAPPDYQPPQEATQPAWSTAQNQQAPPGPTYPPPQPYGPYQAQPPYQTTVPLGIQQQPPDQGMIRSTAVQRMCFVNMKLTKCDFIRVI